MISSHHVNKKHQEEESSTQAGGDGGGSDSTNLQEENNQDQGALSYSQQSSEFSRLKSKFSWVQTTRQELSEEGYQDSQEEEDEQECDSSRQQSQQCHSPGQEEARQNSWSQESKAKRLVKLQIFSKPKPKGFLHKHESYSNSVEGNCGVLNRKNNQTISSKKSKSMNTNFINSDLK